MTTTPPDTETALARALLAAACGQRPAPDTPWRAVLLLAGTRGEQPLLLPLLREVDVHALLDHADTQAGTPLRVHPGLEAALAHLADPARRTRALYAHLAPYDLSELDGATHALLAVGGDALLTLSHGGRYAADGALLDLAWAQLTPRDVARALGVMLQEGILRTPHWSRLLTHPDLERAQRQRLYAHLQGERVPGAEAWVVPLVSRGDLGADEWPIIVRASAGQWHHLPPAAGDAEALGALGRDADLPPPWELLRRPGTTEHEGLALLRGAAPFGWGTHDWTPDPELVHTLPTDAPASWLRILLDGIWGRDAGPETLGALLSRLGARRRRRP